MADWSHGYTTDIEYTSGFYRELAPFTLQLALLLKGVQPPSLSSFSYCELGFGQGVSLNILAAAFPNGDFWGTDFNPAHAAHAQRLARGAGLDNLHLFDKSFAEFAGADLPQFDFISLHGIYSWVSPENRRTIVDFIGRHLKVGGVVYISYNCLPGWAAAMPLRQLLAQHAERSKEPPVARVRSAIAFAGRLKEAGAAYFTQNPMLGARFDKLGDMPVNYLAHEYLNQAWHPQYFSEVATELAEAKLSFAASAHIADHLDMVNFDEPKRAFLNGIEDPLFRETMRDYLLNPQFRRDIFVKGPTRLSQPEQTELLNALGFALTTPRDRVPLKMTFPVGEMTLGADIYNPLLDQLAAGARSVASLSKALVPHTLSAAQLIQALTVLSASGHVAPAGVVEEAVVARTAALNRAIAGRNRHGHELAFLASPVLRSGIPVDRIDQIFLLARAEQTDPVAFAWKSLQALGQRLVKDGKTLETAEDNQAELRARLIAFEGRLPFLRSLGIA